SGGSESPAPRAIFGEAPEPLLIEHGDAMAFLPEALDLEELPSSLAARRLQRVGPTPDHDGRAHRRRAMNDRAGALCRADRLGAPAGQDPGEREVDPSERPRRSGPERRRAMAEGLDQLVGALVPLSALADAAVHDLLQMVRARQAPDLARADPIARVALDEHPEELADLVDVVARLPLGDGAVQDLERRRQAVPCPGSHTAAVPHPPHDPEIAELQRPVRADEDAH